MISSRLTELRTLATDTSLTRKAAQEAITELCDALQACQRRREKAIGPALQDVMSYAQEIGLNSGEPEKFFDYFTARGWKMGRTASAPMRDWKAALRNWKRNCTPETAKPKPTYGVE